MLVYITGCNRNASNVAAGQRNNTAAKTQFNAGQETSGDNGVNSTNDKAPDFTLLDSKGEKISLSDYKGKIVIVDFWATWCPPCRRGIPDLIDIQKEFRDKVVVLGISLDIDTKDKVIPFIESFGINYPVLFASPEVVQAYGNIDSIPTTFIIDKSGNIIDQYIGLTPKETYINIINKLMEKS
jgi:peroxiredoxin